MQIILIITIALHGLSGVFWAGTTFAAARDREANAERLFGPQMGAALIAVITGALMWHFLHEGVFRPAEIVLAIGTLTAILAAGVQGAMIGGARRRLASATAPEETLLRARMAKGEGIAAGLLAVTVICMVIQRFV